MLCAGRTWREGWTRIDANPKMEPDIVATIPPLPAEVTRQLWDEVELVHGIGTFYPWDAEQLLFEIRGVLSGNGKLILEQPNAWNCSAALRPEWVFGDPTFRNPLHMNKWIYTPDTLTALLRQCGYSRIAEKPAEYHGGTERDFRIEASR